jgi:hypothetical protein
MPLSSVSRFAPVFVQTRATHVRAQVLGLPDKDGTDDLAGSETIHQGMQNAVQAIQERIGLADDLSAALPSAIET